LLVNSSVEKQKAVESRFDSTAYHSAISGGETGIRPPDRLLTYPTKSNTSFGSSAQKKSTPLLKPMGVGSRTKENKRNAM
jgi:hypothetical protein